MARISPYVFRQELDNNGDPLAGGKIYTYAAGTSTPKATYTTSDESTANANPVILDDAGRADIWLDSGAYKFAIYSSSDVLIKEVDNITGDASNTLGYTITELSTNTNITTAYSNYFVDCTAAITLSLLEASVADEGFVFIVKNSSAGNVTLDPDASELIDGASTVIVGAGQSAMVFCTGTSWKTALLYDGFGTNNTWTGTNDFQADVSITGAQLQLSKGADVASATALPILTDGNFFDVTGTTAITSINTSGKVGTQITLQFDGVLTLTHHATDLILPTGANITTAARDIAQFVEYASGDWVCTSYQRADGTSLAEASNITIGTMQTATGSETVIDFTSIPSDVKKITLSFADAGTNGTNHYLVQLGDSGGLETAGYTSSSAIIDTTPSVVSNTTGFIIGNQSSSDNKNGHLMLTLVDEATNLWSSSHDFTGVASDYISTGAGSKALSATLDRIRVTTVGGTDTFDSGSKFNISYEV